MTYSEKVKVSKKLYSSMEGMADDDVLSIQYKGDPYEIYCYHYKFNDSKDWSIYKDGRYWSGMNIDSRDKRATSMKAYTFDMMGNRTTYKFKMQDIKVGKLKPKKK